jgi:small subunit ribosomal protein S27Ae
MADDKKKAVKKKPSKKLYKIYDNGKLKNKTCPKCGQGCFLAAHKNRHTCGKCGYMETISSEKKEEKKEDKK